MLGELRAREQPCARVRCPRPRGPTLRTRRQDGPGECWLRAGSTRGRGGPRTGGDTGRQAHPVTVATPGPEGSAAGPPSLFTCESRTRAHTVCSFT